MTIIKNKVSLGSIPLVEWGMSKEQCTALVDTLFDYPVFWISRANTYAIRDQLLKRV